MFRRSYYITLKDRITLKQTDTLESVKSYRFTILYIHFY